MKKLLLLGALTAITLFQAAQPSEAYFRGKWCAKMDAGAGVVGERCDFRTSKSAAPTSTPSEVVVRAEPVARRHWGIVGDRAEEHFNRIYR